MTEHSPEAKTAYPDPIAPWDSAEALREVEISRTAFDRGRESALADLAALREHPFVGIGFESGTTFALTGENVGHWVEGSPTHVPLAERQTTDRETLMLTLHREGAFCGECEYENALWSETPGEVEWRCLSCEKSLGSYADAILALPSTPITSTREALIATADRAARDRVHDDLCMCSDYPASCVTYGSAEALHPYFDAETVVDDLLASGLVKDNGDAPDEWVLDPSGLMGGYVCSVCKTPVESEPCEEHQPRKYAGIEPIAPVDRLAVIREVMAYMDQVEAPRVAIKIGQHFGVAPVEEEA